jgi:hypothetical protein
MLIPVVMIRLAAFCTWNYYSFTTVFRATGNFADVTTISHPKILDERNRLCLLKKSLS